MNARILNGGGPIPIGAFLLVLVASPLPLLAQERIDERRPLAPDGRLTVSVVDHAVRVESWDQNEVHLTGTLDPSTHRIAISGSGRAVDIHVRPDRPPRPSGAGAALELRVPRRAGLSVSTISGSVSIEGSEGTVRVNTVGGTIYLVGSPEVAELHTIHGGIELDGPVPDVRLHTVSGHLRVRGPTARVNVNSVSAHVDLEGETPLQQVGVRTVSGRISVASPLAPGANVTLESHSGPVVLRVPRGTPANYDTSSFSGPIRNGLTADEPRSALWSNALYFTVGAGSSRVQVNTFSGPITLEPLD